MTAKANPFWLNFLLVKKPINSIVCDKQETLVKSSQQYFNQTFCPTATLWSHATENSSWALPNVRWTQKLVSVRSHLSIHPSIHPLHCSCWGRSSLTSHACWCVCIRVCCTCWKQRMCFAGVQWIYTPALNIKYNTLPTRLITSWPQRGYSEREIAMCLMLLPLLVLLSGCASCVYAILFFCSVVHFALRHSQPTGPTEQSSQNSNNNRVKQKSFVWFFFTTSNTLYTHS